MSRQPTRRDAPHPKCPEICGLKLLASLGSECFTCTEAPLITGSVMVQLQSRIPDSELWTKSNSTTSSLLVTTTAVGFSNGLDSTDSRQTNVQHEVTNLNSGPTAVFTQPPVFDVASNGVRSEETRRDWCRPDGTILPLTRAVCANILTTPSRVWESPLWPPKRRPFL